MAHVRKTARDSRGERGFAIVEFALALPVLLLLLAAIVDFGMAFQMKQVLASAAHEGARVGVAPACLQGCPRPSTSVIVDEASGYLSSVGVDPSVAVVNVTGAGGEKGDILSVEVLYPSEFLFLSSALDAVVDAGSSFGADLTLGARVVAEIQ